MLYGSAKYAGLSNSRLISRYQEEPEEEYCPEQYLIAEIIIRAIYDIILVQKIKGQEAIRLRIRARGWIFAPRRPIEPPFSFNWCCDQIGVSPSFLRKTVREILHKTNSNIIPCLSKFDWIQYLRAANLSLNNKHAA